jgi:CBS domain-containing protein
MRQLRVAHDIMVSRLVTLTPETDVFEGIARLLQANVTGAPVIDAHNNYHGVFSDRCCLNVLTKTVELAGIGAITHGNWLARDVMAKNLVTLTPDMDAFDAIAMLLKRRISGAPVVDSNGQFIGSFSEKTSMNLLLGAAYEQLPTCQVRAFMDTDFGRVIDEEKDLLALARMFEDTYYRRLPVLRDGKLVGQVSRRDVLKAAYPLSQQGRLLVPSGQDHLAEHRTRANPGSQQVEDFMDAHARAISEHADLLQIAQIFRETQHRRLPVVRNGKLLGLVSRRDLPHATNDVITHSPQREKTLLYLSATTDRADAPIY